MAMINISQLTLKSSTCTILIEKQIKDVNKTGQQERHNFYVLCQHRHSGKCWGFNEVQQTADGIEVIFCDYNSLLLSQN